MAKNKKKSTGATAESNDDANKVINVPNVITAVRLVLSIAVFYFLSQRLFTQALVAFVIAASTDWIDGYWARKFNQVTKVGRVFDPIVDKIIICGAFVFLVAEPRSGVAAWVAVLVMGREMLVTAIRSFIEQSGGDFSAQMSGKIKMLLQCIAVVASIILLRHLKQFGDDAAVPQWLQVSVPVSVWAAVAITIYSGLEYVVAAARRFRA